MTDNHEIRSGDAPEAGPGVAPPGFRAPAQTRVGRVRLQVADLERSIGFYRDLLGFQLLEEAGNSAALGAGPHPGRVGSEGGGGPDRGRVNPLVELVERPGAAPVPPRGRLGLFHFAVLLPSRAALGRTLAHLARSEVRIGSADHLVSEALYLSDPDGLGIEIYADRPRSSWRTDGREIVMATDPLDLQGLVAAGGDEAWSGLPAGTTMGHIHLSVGDLETAEAFYHRGLGLDEVVWRYPGALFFSAGGYHHHLGTNTWARGAAPAAEDDARLLEWRLVYPDAGAVSDALASVADAGFADAVDRTGSRVTDPYGVRVRLGTHA